MSVTTETYDTLCFTSLSWTQQIKLERVTNTMQCTVRATTRLAVRVSSSCRYTWRALSAISRQELQTVFNNLFTECQTLPDSCRGSVISNTHSKMRKVIWGNVELAVRLGSVFYWSPCISSEDCEAQAFTGRNNNKVTGRGADNQVSITSVTSIPIQPNQLTDPPSPSLNS
jgi:hypothetical protein